MSTDHHVVILGAGYTGMLTAIRLAHRNRGNGVRITLVNPSPHFVERLRLHQVAAGQRLAEHRITDLLTGTGVRFVQGRATAIDPDAHTVEIDGAADNPNGQDHDTLDHDTQDHDTQDHDTQDHDPLSYDTLVYALGSATDTSRVPGADTHAFTLNGPHNARRFADRLSRVAAAGGPVTVTGGGLTGVEAATEIAESHPGIRVTLISLERPGAMMGPKARAHLDRALDRLGITVQTGRRVTKVLPGGVELADGTTVPSDATLWTTGVAVPPLAREAGIAVDERGLVVVDGTLRSVSHPDIHVVGDAAAIRLAWGRIHGTCQSGLPTAQYTADAISRLLRGKEVGPFRFGYFHQPVSLGRRDAVIQFTHADDTPRRAYIAGRAAILYKEFVSGSPLLTYRLSKRMNVSVTPAKGGRATRRPALPAA